MPFTFTPLKSFVDATFFAALSQHKLEVAKLDEDRVAIHGFLDFAAKGRGPAVRFSAKSFGKVDRDGYNHAIGGFILNYNTLDAFKALDKRQFLALQARRLETLISSKQIFETPNELLRFFAVSYSDLKKYKYYYWFCFPSLHWASSVKDVDQRGDDEIDALVVQHLTQSDDGGLVYALDHTPTWHVKHLRSLDFRSRVAKLGTVDFGSQDGQLPWHLRNVGAALAPYFDEAVIYVYRPNGNSYWAIVELEAAAPDAAPVGWERNSQGSLVPKITDLSALQDPTQLAEQAVDLNLKLMKWRAAPQIDLDGLKAAKVLLLGAGTLGCYVARGLMAWGVRHLTLVDSGVVSYSNPVRQPLFTAEDATAKRPKAEAAAAALRAISPGVQAQGLQLEIPMAGHPVTEEAKQRGDFDQLQRLVDAHDVIYLLMDSRESRWLPTVLGAAKGKLVMNVALGFDSWLAMRHGVPGAGKQLGCYFCNDVVAPIDSLSGLSLDQMCTVTRPGVAPLASATCVELLATLYQHPQRGHAPHDEDTILGKTSHQLRGFLSTHTTVSVWGPAFENCPGCSPQILDAYREDGWDFVKAALNKRDFLTELSGLGDLQRQTEDLDLSDESGEFN